jgi:hypothetical protein
MKKIFLLIAVLLIWRTGVYSQTPGLTGKPIVEIFTDLHVNLSGENKTGFALNRAYFGYNYTFDRNFSTTIMFNVGSPDDLPVSPKPRRYAFLREVSITYSVDRLNVSFGMVPTRLYMFQQKFWGKRYVADTYQSINGYGPVADLGVAAEYKFNDIISADFTLLNGEGYTSLQLDNSLKPSLGITITPVQHLYIRLFGDAVKTSGLWQSTLVAFTGFKNDFLYIGAEVSYKTNLDLINGHHAWGISTTGGINLSKNFEFFTRLDYSTSVIPAGDIAEWNYKKDGSFLITGIQHSFNSSVRIALDYQSTFPIDMTKTISDMIFLNAVFKF